MDKVSMHDGLDGRETIAFGLAAGEVAVFVLSLMAAYAVLRSGLAGAVAWMLASALAGGGAALAWGRLAGRPMLEWAVLLVRFAVRTRHSRADRLRGHVHGWTTAVRSVRARLRLRMASHPAASRSLQGGAVVVPLPLRRLERAGAAAPGVRAAGASQRSHVVGFFSLCGGTGRTTLAVEVAVLVAVRGRAATAARSKAMRVVLLDVTARNPVAGIRLGIAAPVEPTPRLIAHPTGLLVGLPPASTLPCIGDPGRLRPLIDDAEVAGADIVIVDFDCDLGDLCNEVLQRCDQVLVTLTPTAAGVLDAYRSTAVLRRLGLRDRIRYVVNRWRDGFELEETMADLGGDVRARIPDHPALVEAERRQRAAGLEESGDLSTVLGRLARDIEGAAGLRRSERAGSA